MGSFAQKKARLQIPARHARLPAMADEEGSAGLAALLAWYREMGVDEVVGDIPVNWLERGNVPPRQDVLPSADSRDWGQSRPVPPPAAQRPPEASGAALRRQFPAAGPDTAVHSARSAARQAADLDELGATLAGFDGCSLKATAKNLCFYRGAGTARIMLIGEAPGRDEDIEGKPFVGRAGQLLDKMLAAIQLGEKDVHITNIVYWRPPGNRTPTPQEAQVCRPFLERQVELVAPEVIVLLGGAAAKHILDVAEGIMRVRGKWREIEIGAHKARVIATLHPAYLLRTPAAKRLAWRDLLTVKTSLDGQ
jgi:DNA polymerase